MEKLDDLLVNPGFNKLSTYEQDVLIGGLFRSAKKAKVLVVDPLPESAELCWRVLNEKGYETWCACDARSALAAVKEVRPDLILLGVAATQLDGFAVLRELRADLKTTAIKVIMTGITTMYWEEARRNGAQDFVGVPLDLKLMCEKVARVLRS